MLLLFIYKLRELIININIVDPYGADYHHNNHHNHHKVNSVQKKESVDIDDDDINNMDINDYIPSSDYNQIQYGHHHEHYHKFKELSVPSRSAENDKYESGSTILSSLLHAADLDEHQLELIVVITRHAILSGFAIFFNQMFYAVNYVSMKPNLENSTWFGLFVYGLRLIGMIGITICLYLSMKFAKGLYFNCCGCCHLNCYKICIKCTRKSIATRLTMSKKRSQTTSKKRSIM